MVVVKGRLVEEIKVREKVKKWRGVCVREMDIVGEEDEKKTTTNFQQKTQANDFLKVFYYIVLHLHSFYYLHP